MEVLPSGTDHVGTPVPVRRCAPPPASLKLGRASLAWTGEDTCPYVGVIERALLSPHAKISQSNASRRATPHGAAAGGPRNPPPESGNRRAAQTRGCD